MFVRFVQLFYDCRQFPDNALENRIRSHFLYFKFVTSALVTALCQILFGLKWQVRLSSVLNDWWPFHVSGMTTAVAYVMYKQRRTILEMFDLLYRPDKQRELAQRTPDACCSSIDQGRLQTFMVESHATCVHKVSRGRVTKLRERTGTLVACQRSLSETLLIDGYDRGPFGV